MYLVLGLLLFGLTGGCASPIALHRAVLEYDWTVNRIETELLLLNIARMRYHESIHFTAVSSIAATFDFRVNTGLTGILSEIPSTNSLALTLGTSVSENPTVSIIPIQGEAFTKRLLTPIAENRVQFFVQQGVDPGILLRLMAYGIFVEDDGSRRFLVNRPNRVEEYREFRQRVLHLSSLQYTRQLYIGPIPLHDGSFRTSGRIVITNYYLEELSKEDRTALHNRIQHYPLSYLFVDIRPGFPGGEFPWRGQIKLRSFKSILGFIGRGIAEEQEFDVKKDPRTGPVLVNPVQTLKIHESKSYPVNPLIVVQKRNTWYWIEQGEDFRDWTLRWNHEAFDVLYELYHLTVTDVSKSPTVPITIAK